MITFDEAMTYINSFDRLGKPVSDLNRMVALLSLLGDPQKDLKFIHIAGTNGKGSVAQMCSDILINAGYRVGTFTSPFMVEYSDRIRVNNENIKSGCLCETIAYVKKIVDKIEYKSFFSQFEISTAIAFLYFRNMRCDIVVLETGIGGKLDATNVIKSPIVSIITSISHDHDKILGDTLKEIANQKAGIIKPKCPCVLSAKNPTEVIHVIENACNNNKSELVIPNCNKFSMLSSKITGSEFLYKAKSYKIRMSGEHQIINALTVIEAMEFVNKSGFLVTYTNIYEGLKKSMVFARGEILANNPLIILDGAHNPAGMNALANILSKVEYKYSIAVVGMQKDKNAKLALKEIAPYITDFVCVDGFSENAMPAEELVRIIKSLGKKAFSVYDVRLAITEAKEFIKDGDLLLICGSLYLASTARKIYIG